ncbi:MAG: DUF4342 domain-containing protein [Firmicutes bacterium]|nr:DUF4342 domain-containing protein [Bacillota bacterium]
MEITLEKIELVKDRTGVTYAEAKQALEEADGSVVDAIIAIEESVNLGEKRSAGIGAKTDAVIGTIKEQISKGNVSKIRVRRDGELILNVPLNAGILGLVIAPIASVAGIVAAFGFKCNIEVVKEDGTILDISDAVTDAVGTVTEKGSAAASAAREKAEELYAKGKEKAEEAADKAEEVKAKASEKAEEVKAKFADAAEDIEEAVEEAASEAEEAAEEVAEEAEEAVDAVVEEVAEEE